MKWIKQSDYKSAMSMRAEKRKNAGRIEWKCVSGGREGGSKLNGKPEKR
jgi:hypothetical protein